MWQICNDRCRQRVEKRRHNNPLVQMQHINTVFCRSTFASVDRFSNVLRKKKKDRKLAVYSRDAIHNSICLALRCFVWVRFAKTFQSHTNTNLTHRREWKTTNNWSNCRGNHDLTNTHTHTCIIILSWLVGELCMISISIWRTVILCSSCSILPRRKKGKSALTMEPQMHKTHAH